MKNLGPLLAIAILIVVLRLRKRDVADTLALRRPPMLKAIAWIAVGLAYMLITDAILHWRGPWDFAPWHAQPFLVSVMRVMAVCFLGPIAEELIVRGALFDALYERKKLPAAVAIVITAAIWAVIHWNYDWPTITLILGSGLLLGTARWTTRSIYVPIVMHVLWNLYAVW